MLIWWLAPPPLRECGAAFAQLYSPLSAVYLAAAVIIATLLQARSRPHLVH